MRCAFAQRLRPFERCQRGLAVFAEDDLAGFINGDCFALFIQREHAFGAQDDVVCGFRNRASLQCSAAHRVTQDFALELGREGFGLLGALADGLQLFVVVTAQALGVPAYTLLGGLARSRVPVTHSIGLLAIDEAVAFKHGRDIASVQKALNEGKEISETTHVFAARATDDGKVLVTLSETPYEARMRLQSGGKDKEHEEALSFHSAIPNNPEHSRRVLAYDVAIGAGESVDDVTFYAYLCRVADWRLDWERTHTEINGQNDEESFETKKELIRVRIWLKL